MKEQMQKILQQQQEYEYLKKSPSLLHLSSNLFVSGLTTKTVFPYIKKANQKQNRQKLQNRIAKIIFYLFFYYYIFCYVIYYYLLLIYPLMLIE